jgi:hypothetical protein
MKFALTVVAGIAVAASSVQAVTIDLTQPGAQSGTINQALFETSDFRSGGTGVIESFVRLQQSGFERGYNTSGRPVAFNENTSGQFTRDLTLGQVPVRSIGGTDYYEFILDINQTNNNPLLTLLQVKIYTSLVGSQTTSNVDSLGTMRYNMDAGGNSSVELDYSRSSGSGQGDMNLYVPVALFGGAAGNQFVYLYSEFGEPGQPTNDGFEEWAVRSPGNPPVIPLPSASIMGLAGLMGVATLRRRKA